MKLLTQTDLAGSGHSGCHCCRSHCSESRTSPLPCGLSVQELGTLLRILLRIQRLLKLRVLLRILRGLLLRKVLRRLLYGLRRLLLLKILRRTLLWLLLELLLLLRQLL